MEFSADAGLNSNRPSEILFHFIAGQWVGIGLLPANAGYGSDKRAISVTSDSGFHQLIHLLE